MRLAGVYTQPFSLFVPVSHLTWIFLKKNIAQKQNELAFVSIIIALSGLLFLPWYLYGSAVWKESIAAYRVHGEITLRSISMILHELVGVGYIGTGIVLLAGALAATSTKMRGANGLFWILYLLVPIACVLMVDDLFGYFLAIRQMIFVVAPVCVLVALAVQRQGRLGVALGLGFLIAALWNDVKLFSRPRENWQSAASILKAEAREGSCVLFAPADSAVLYTFFVPELPEYECQRGIVTGRDRVALAISPVDLDQTDFGVEQQLVKAGFTKVGDLNPLTPRIELFERKRSMKSR